MSGVDPLVREVNEMMARLAPDDLEPPYVEVSRRVPDHPFKKHLAHIERMAAQGMKPDLIAARLNVPLAVLQAAAEQFEDVRVAFTGGLARGIDEASGSVFRAARRGDVAAAKFLLQSRGDFAPSSRQQTDGPPSGSAPAPIDLSGIQKRLDDQRGR